MASHDASPSLPVREELDTSRQSDCFEFREDRRHEPGLGSWAARPMPTNLWASEGLPFHNPVRSGLATMQPELMDACLDWMPCISIDASWLLS